MIVMKQNLEYYHYKCGTSIITMLWYMTREYAIGIVLTGSELDFDTT